MLRFDTTLCEPLRAWNRIEPRPRHEEFGQALQAQIHDPLWMLTRQWQFGEFRGEDTGSAILAKLVMEIDRVTHLKTRQSAAETVDQAMPMETRVERQPLPLDFRTRVAAGWHWLKFLDSAGLAYNASGPADPYQPDQYQALFLEHFPMPEPDVDSSNAVALNHQAVSHGPRLAQQFLRAAQARALDGLAVYTRIAQSSGAITWPMAIPAGHRTWLEQAARSFQAWFDRLHGITPASANRAWNPSQLEYQFACATTGQGGRQTVLSADDYSHGKLDWYAFDVDPNTPALASTPGPAAGETRVLTVIPTEARFGGMPNARWWEFENGSIDLGHVQADTTDLAKILLVQFALVYSNDWFLLPVKVPVGSLSHTQGILVTDVFGVRTWVEAAGGAEAGAWSAWSLFHLSVKPKTGQTVPGTDTRLFVPPAVVKPLESEDVEAVRFLRDEAANQVWGVETRVQDHLGQGWDGVDAARQRREFFTRWDMPAPETAPVDGAALTYRVSRAVPENWIPFLPVHQPGSRRAIRLQRGSMPRFFRQTIHPIRPQTTILRPGLNPDDTQSSPYFIHEEEITRAGTQVSATHQRIRWFHGQVCTWYGLRKRVGRGEGSSGLAFDLVSEIKK